MISILPLFHESEPHTGQLNVLSVREMCHFNQDGRVVQHLFKISPNCNEAQLSVPNTGGLTRHANDRCGKDVRMSRVGTLCVSFGED